MDSSNLIAIIKSVNRGIQDKIGNHTQMQVEHEEEYFLDWPGLHDSSCTWLKNQWSAIFWVVCCIIKSAEHRCFTFLVLTERRRARAFSPALLLLPLAEGSVAEGGLHGAPRAAHILSVALIFEAWLLLFSVNTRVFLLLKSSWHRSISSPFLILLR